MSYRFDGLAEFISRRARVKLVEMLRNVGLSAEQIAEAVGVTARSVQRWLSPEDTHPRNSNLDKLLELALTVDRAKTIEILRQEVELFSSLFNMFEANSLRVEPNQAEAKADVSDNINLECLPRLSGTSRSQAAAPDGRRDLRPAC